jgi:hypothetical protein
MENLDYAINMLATLGANPDNVEAAIVAFRFKHKEGEATPEVEVLTIGDDAVSMLGVGEFVKCHLYDKLSKQGGKQ